jgi:hypothetical protein
VNKNSWEHFQEACLKNPPEVDNLENVSRNDKSESSQLHIVFLRHCLASTEQNVIPRGNHAVELLRD